MMTEYGPGRCVVNKRSEHETVAILRRNGETKRDGYAYARVVPFVTNAERGSCLATALRLHITFKLDFL